MSGYIYTYRSSEGERLTGEIEAVSRDEAFAELRKRGIRPIRVSAKDGSKANGEIRGVRKRVTASIAIVAALLAGVAAFWAGRSERIDAGQSEVETTPTSYAEAAKAVHQQLESGEKLIAFHKLTDWKAMSKTDDFSAFHDEVEKGRQLVKLLLMQLKGAFADASDAEARRMYGREVTEVEAFRDRIEAYAEILALLEDRQGEWKADGNGVKFADATIQAEFEALKDASGDAEAAKWRRDFGRGICSEPIEVPRVDDVK